jgi:hypothetical protein
LYVFTGRTYETVAYRLLRRLHSIGTAQALDRPQ